MMSTCAEKIYSDEYADILRDYVLTGEDQSDPLLGYCYVKIDDLLGVVYSRRSGLPELSVSNYTYRSIPNLFGLMENISFPLLKSGIIQVQNAPLELTGKSVIIGIADTGIDYTADVFRKEDGSTRILAIWDQTIPLANPEFSGSDSSRVDRWNDGTVPKLSSADVPFGTVYSMEDINRALQSDDPYAIVPTRDEVGHGSAMACAAGGKNSQWIYGGATDAEFVVVKLKEAKPYLKEYYQMDVNAPAYQETDLMLSYRFIDSYDIIFQRPVVFLLGIGTNMGAHDGTSLFSEYLNDLSAKRSRAVVVCAGNEGNQASHFEGEGDQDIEIRVGEGEQGFVLEIWGSVPYVFSVGITTPGGESIPNQITTGGGLRTFRFIYESAVITIERILVEQSSGKELVFIRFQNPSPGIWRVQVRDAGTFNAWLPIRAFLSGDTFFLASTPERTITVPGFAQAVITVSGYNDFDNSIYADSGRGNGTIPQKPDIAAPAVEIPVATFTGRPGTTLITQDPGIPTTVTGTSYAAAITAGAVAQFFEWAVIRDNDPTVKSREIKSYLQRGAGRDADKTYPNNLWGFGRLDMLGTFNKLVGV